jgi:hypothetical protein
VTGVDANYQGPRSADYQGQHEALIEHLARSISAVCGRCSGRGTERHQLDRDPAAGYGEHRCPTCRGDGRNVVNESVTAVAERVLNVLSSLPVEQRAEAMGMVPAGWFWRSTIGGGMTIYADTLPNGCEPVDLNAWRAWEEADRG